MSDSTTLTVGKLYTYQGVTYILKAVNSQSLKVVDIKTGQMRFLDINRAVRGYKDINGHLHKIEPS